MVEVDVETNIDEATNKAKLHFVINEGQKVQIKGINVEGNVAFRDKKIIKIIKTRQKGIFRSGYLKDGEETALFDAATANRFRACILETGGSRPAGELFAEFRGRAPHIHALLRSLGIIGEMHA